jgi:hypothetical protein
MRTNLIRLAVVILALVTGASALSQSPAPAPAPQAPTAPTLSQAQLDQLLAPVALYPDELVSKVLMASTYPLEVVQAARWVQDAGHAKLKGDQLAAALQSEDWDPSVKSLVPFPQILGMMNERLDWMQKLGDAFLSQPDDVTDSVQRLRRQAQAAGTLKSSPQQVVTDQDQTITVEPANPDMVYPPVYDPTVVYGGWPYPDYPPYYFQPPPFCMVGPPIYPGWWWCPAIDVGYFGPFWGWDHWDWRHHRIHVDRDRFDRLEGSRHPRSGDTWEHDPYHRRGVAYRDTATGSRFGRPVAGSPEASRAFRGYQEGRGIAPSGLPGRQGLPGPAGTQSGQPATRQPPTVFRGQTTIFDRSGSGDDSRAHSERGHASQQTIVPSGPSGFSGGARGFSGGASRESGGGFGGRSSGGGGQHR